MPTYSRWGSPGGGGGRASYNVAGLVMPRAIAWLIGATVVVSAVGALLKRNGVPILDLLVLYAPAVWAGQVWRLVTWTLLELDPIGLLFGCMLLYFIAPDLLYRWGTRRFFALYFGGAALVGAVTSVVGRFLWADLYAQPHWGIFAMGDALLIAWAVLMPDRQILAFFVLPISGRGLITLTIAITVLFALFGSFASVFPIFVAEMLALAYMDVISIRRLYLRGRMAMLQRDYRRRTAHLHMVGRDDDEPPRWTH